MMRYLKKDDDVDLTAAATSSESSALCESPITILKDGEVWGPEEWVW
jgi:hypothetical protein